MLELLANIKDDRIYRLLCLGAHSDDIEIGCGGTLLKLQELYGNLSFRWVVFSSDDVRATEARDSANAFLKNAKDAIIEVNRFRDGYFPFIGSEIKDYFERLKRTVDPDIVFTHFRNDLHQDHRLISELTWNTFRDHLILEYEVFKYDGDLGSPNFFVELNEEQCQSKIDCILNCFQTQRKHRWFSRENFESIMRIRGVESNAHDRYAEAFYCRKLVSLGSGV
jgi:LmbE family N-acetylglucosaminyl deacetylase